MSADVYLCLRTTGVIFALYCECFMLALSIHSLLLKSHVGDKQALPNYVLITRTFPMVVPVIGWLSTLSAQGQISWPPRY